MVEEIATRPEEIIEEQPENWFLEKLKIHKFKILVGILGILVFAGAIFGAYKLGQRQVQPGLKPTPTPGLVATRVYCKDPRPEVCTMECIINPPYICGSNGKSYCNVCGACAGPDVEWYIIQDKPCGGM